jgi:hypothetical protein|tara:strand:- start:11509 stop:11703 length:195 start_codon:yes stop_codon:yes gene_type:complete
MFIEQNYQQVKVPEAILEFCDYYTYDAERNNIRYLDCVFMNMGEYGNDPKMLENLRKRIYPVFQ